MNVTPLRCLGLGLVFVVSSAVAQVSTSCIPTKNQVVLRQRVAELEAAEGRLDTRILQAEVDALKRRGMINEQQAEEFAAIIEQAQAPKGPLDTPEGAALARQALAAKVTELQSADAEPIPESDPEVYAKASAVLEDKMKALRAPAPAPAQAGPDHSARQAVALAALASVMTEMSAAQPLVDDDSDEAIQAKAQAALAEKIAELDRQAAAKVAPPIRTDAAAQAAAQQALAEKMAELDRQAAETAKPPPVAPTVAAPRSAPVPTAPPPPAAPVVTAPVPVEPPPPAAPVVVTTPWPTPAPAPKPVVVTPAPAPEPPPVAEVVVAPGDDHRAAALAALESKMTDLNRQEGVSITGVPVQPPSVPPGEHLQATQLLRETVTAPFGVLETPPAPKTGWDRLNELTDLYRANRITPREYHVERAKLMEALAQ